MKANYIGSKVGYPELIFNDTYMNELYKDFLTNDTDYLRNSLHIMKLDVKKNFERLRRIKSDEWITGPAVVNAFYSAYSNEICNILFFFK